MIGDELQQTTATFSITSLEEAEKFTEQLSRYGEVTSAPYDVRVHIQNIYKYSRVHSKEDRINGKLLNAYIDLELTYLFMMKDMLSAVSIHNRLKDTGKIDSNSVFEDYELFFGKMNILYSLSAFSFRIRAFWDKYMGVLFLIYENQKYEKYIKAKSKKSFFIRHAKNWPEISPNLQNCLTNIVRTWLIHLKKMEVVKEIDSGNVCIQFPYPFLNVFGEIIEMVNTVRTPEAHGAGVLRKWTLANLPLDKSKDFGLINHWNNANEFMQALRTTIAELAARNPSPQR